MKNFLDLARRRRSIRKYLADDIGADILGRILEAGKLAPSGNNSQPWRFIVVRDAATKRRLYDVAGRQDWILKAPVTIAVVGDITTKIAKKELVGERVSVEDPEHQAVLLKTVRDTTIAANHIVMAATDEGLGSCWIALFEQKDIRPVLGVPEHCYVVALITMGKPAEAPSAKPRHDLRDIVFEEKYGIRGSWIVNRES